jgi:hypothetical protein
LYPSFTNYVDVFQRMRFWRVLPPRWEIGWCGGGMVVRCLSGGVHVGSGAIECG